MCRDAVGMALVILLTAGGVGGYEVSLVTPEIATLETAGAVTVAVARAGVGTGSCSAGFMTIAGSARAGRDFEPVSGRIGFADGETQATIIVPLISNTVPNEIRGFEIVLHDTTNCTGMVTTGTVAVVDAQTVASWYQGFESGLPLGWSVVTNGAPGCAWRFDNPGERLNSTGGTGIMAIADSDEAGSYAMDTELRSEPFAVAATGLAYLAFRTDYYNCTYEIADVDVSIAGAEGPWVNLWRKEAESYRGHTDLVDLTPVARGQSNVVVRFHYYNADYDWYWEVDDVALLLEADSNTNGLPDWWETAYWGSLTNLDARGDSDQDGACDEDEFIAGASPRDTGSCFRVEALAFANSSVTLDFRAGVGRFYNIAVSTNLMGPGWSNGISRFEGLGGPTNVSLPAVAPCGYYRLEVRRW